MPPLSGLIPRFTIRTRLAIALAVAILPFMIVLLLAYFWVYQPLQVELRALSRDVEVRFDSVARLQVALTRATMPVNDYLIHGHAQERREFELASARVEAAFVAVRSALADTRHSEHDRISAMYEKWGQSARQGAAIFAVAEEHRRSPAMAMAMERFDDAVDRIVDEIDVLLDHVRSDLRHARDQIDARHERMTWFLTISILIAAVVTLVTVVYLGQMIPRQHDGEGDDASY